MHEILQTKRLGRKILFRRVASSTNRWAKELAAVRANEGTVVLAETQISGRGRLGREWISPAGGLWFSVVLRPELDAEEVTKVVFVAGLAVAKVLRELYGLHVETKWPNDVLVNGRKVCGILAEMNTTDRTVNFAVLGIGINANFDTGKALPEEVRTAATSLEDELGENVLLGELLEKLLEELESLYEQFLREGFSPILKMWKRYATFIGSTVEVAGKSEKLSGVALDVASDGALVLKLEDETVKHLFIGDVSLRIGRG